MGKKKSTAKIKDLNVKDAKTVKGGVQPRIYVK